MNRWSEPTTATRGRRSRRRGLTLAELLTSTTIMVILMGAMTSAILVASHALPNGQNPLEKKTQAADIVDQIAGDLVFATTLIRSDADVVRFTVPDRGHGAAGPETMSYAWSGTPGDPLTHQYNGCPDITLCEDVHNFSLEYVRKAKPLSGVPRVLMVVVNKDGPLAQTEPRKMAIESWGFPVQLISASDPQADFDAAVTTSDVAYISAKITASNLGTKLRDAPIGVVNEHGGLCDDFGFSAGYAGPPPADLIDIVDNTHFITSGFTIGSLTICSSAQPLILSDGTLAGGAEVLAEGMGALRRPALAAIEVGRGLYGGGTANGRRVKLPWGGSDLDFKSLNDDGLTLMRRSIVWAAAPVAYTGVRIVLKPTEAPERLRTEVQILNMPKVNAP